MANALIAISARNGRRLQFQPRLLFVAHPNEFKEWEWLEEKAFVACG